MPTTENAPRSKDRHGPRKTISFKPGMYLLLKELAKKNHRPVQWEAELMAREWLRTNGIEPPEEFES